MHESCNAWGWVALKAPRPRPKNPRGKRHRRKRICGFAPGAFREKKWKRGVKLSIPRRVVEQVVPRSMGSNCNGVACARPISWFSSSTHTHAQIRSSDGHLRYDKFMTCQPTTSSSVRLCRSSASACCPCEWRRPRSGSSGRAKVPVVRSG